MNSAFDRLQQAKIFSKLDLHSEYNLVRIRAGDEWKTVYIMPSGHYKNHVMPFGLMNDPTVFQHFISEAINSPTEPPIHKAREVTVSCHHYLILGLYCVSWGLSMDPAKTKVVKEWPRPMLVWVVQWFLGFTNFFQRFVKNFSSLSASLCALTKKFQGKFMWTTEGQ